MAEEENEDLELDLEKINSYQKKKPPHKGVIVLLSLVLCIIIGSLEFLWLWKRHEFQKAAKNSPPPVVEPKKKAAAKHTKDKEAENSHNAPEGEEVSKDKILFYLIRPPFLVNLTPASFGPRFLQIEVTLMTRDSIVFSQLENLLPLIKNRLVLIFSSKSYEELKNVAGKESLRKEALVAINQTLYAVNDKLQIDDLMFSSFVMQ